MRWRAISHVGTYIYVVHTGTYARSLAHAKTQRRYRYLYESRYRRGIVYLYRTATGYAGTVPLTRTHVPLTGATIDFYAAPPFCVCDGSRGSATTAVSPLPIPTCSPTLAATAVAVRPLSPPSQPRRVSLPSTVLAERILRDVDLR